MHILLYDDKEFPNDFNKFYLAYMYVNKNFLSAEDLISHGENVTANFI